MTYLTVTQAAKILGVSRARIYQRLRGGRNAGRPLDFVTIHTGNPGTRKGRQMMIHAKLVAEWKAERGG